MAKTQRQFIDTYTEGYARHDPRQEQKMGPRRKLDKHLNMMEYGGMKQREISRYKNYLQGKEGGVQNLFSVARRHMFASSQVAQQSNLNFQPGDGNAIQTGLHRQAWQSLKPIRRKRLRKMDEVAF